MSSHPSSVKLTIDSRLENVPLVGLAINKLCEYQGMSMQSCYNVELCVVEAVTNAIRHGYRSEAGYHVVLEVSLQPDRMVLDVRDEGRGLHLKAVPSSPADPAQRSTEELQEGGWGLLFIHQFMDAVEYAETPRGTRLILTKLLDDGRATRRSLELEKECR